MNRIHFSESFLSPGFQVVVNHETVFEYGPLFLLEVFAGVCIPQPLRAYIILPSDACTFKVHLPERLLIPFGKGRNKRLPCYKLNN